MANLGSTITSNKRKIDQIYEKRWGSFKDDCLPDHVYPLGNNLFAIVQCYKWSVSLYLRMCRKYNDGTYYPSTDGITLRPEYFHVLSSLPRPPVSISDVVDVNLKLETLNPDKPREIYVLMHESESFFVNNDLVSRSGHVYKSSVNITKSQWDSLLKAHDSVGTSFITLKYRSINFADRFKIYFKNIVKEKVAESDNYSDVEYSMIQCLKNALYNEIGQKKGLTPIIGADMFDSDEENSVTDFNDSCLNLNLYSVMHEFVKEIKTIKISDGKVPLLDFLTIGFLNSISL